MILLALPRRIQVFPITASTLFVVVETCATVRVRSRTGGDLIQASGAADASALFHSMHPGTKPENSKLLQEFIRGEHVRDSKTDPVYAYDTDFAKDVRKSVREVMKGVNWYAPMGFWIRTAVIMALTVVGEWYWMTTGMLMWAMFTGFMHMQVCDCW